MATIKESPSDVGGVTLTRRQFVKTGGALVVGCGLVGAGLWRDSLEAVGVRNTLDATFASSWFEIYADNTILFWTGKTDLGQSTVTTAYKQFVAEELSVPFEAITTIVMGDTDRMPDGGGMFGLLTGGGLNLRKAAAYTYQALLDLAATHLGVPKSQLSVKNGVVSGGGKSISYGHLVQGQQLRLTIPVSGTLTDIRGLTVLGDPPMKPASQYAIIGKSYPNFATESKVTAREVWATNVRLDSMLHARVVHPRTLGSTLICAGEFEKERFPNAQFVIRENLVGVLASTE